MKRELGVTITPIAKGLAETYAWYAAHAPRRNLDFTFEDNLIRAARDPARPHS